MVNTRFMDEFGRDLSDEEASGLFRDMLAHRLGLPPSKVVTVLRRYPGPDECINHLHVEIDSRPNLEAAETQVVLKLCRDLGFPEMSPMD